MPDQATRTARQSARLRWLKALIGLVFVGLTGCLGPGFMYHDLQAYNKDVVSSEQEMLLFNIGRLNRNLPPHFMMLSSVSQSRTFSAGLSFQWTQLWNSLVTPSYVDNAAGAVKNSGTLAGGPLTAGTVENP